MFVATAKRTTSRKYLEANRCQPPLSCLPYFKFMVSHTNAGTADGAVTSGAEKDIPPLSFKKRARDAPGGGNR